MTGPVVRTAAGLVRGRPSAHGVVVHAVPYAAPPVGAGRFADPRPPDAWPGVRDGTRPGPTAPQPRRDRFGALDMTPYFGPGWVRGADHLTVDVHTPDVGGAAPVLVFVHGGGFIAGSPRAPLYGGAAFARDGVVLVRVGYRLGIAGFLHLPDAPDNRGLLDVLAALRWVRENIAAFGGDPDRVTVCGQSAGAVLVGGLLADGRSAGLLHRAILQSGSGTAVVTAEQAERVTRAVAGALGVAPTAVGLAPVDDERLVGALGALAGLDLTTATFPAPLGGITPFGLVLDDAPADRIGQGCADGVDLLVGTTAEEASLYLDGPADVTEADVLATAARVGLDAAAVVAAARARHPTATPAELRTAVLSDGLFGDGTRRTADAHAPAAAATFAYEFAWRSDALDGRLGSCHTLELPFVFGTTALPGLHGPDALLGTTAPPAELVARVHGAWTRFVTAGDPGWPAFRPTTPHVERLGCRSAPPG